MQEGRKWESQIWWYTTVIPALRRLRQEDGEFEDSLGYSKTLSQKTNAKKKEESGMKYLKCLEEKKKPT
jgi:hypothetical protein